MRDGRVCVCCVTMGDTHTKRPSSTRFDAATYYCLRYVLLDQHGINVYINNCHLSLYKGQVNLS